MRRAHLISNSLALAEFRTSCQMDAEALTTFTYRDKHEIALWMLTIRDKAFRDVELHLAFQAKTNGKYWKKHRIQCGLDPCRDRAQLELVYHPATSEVETIVKVGTKNHAVVPELIEKQSATASTPCVMGLMEPFENLVSAGCVTSAIAPRTVVSHRANCHQLQRRSLAR